ncbi:MULTISPECIES: XrtA/PEP-CTERM system histidine kinase PrsK [unclassified Iodidimonas]|jgi:putative PEP-CTERM system histidine kinase|uniref:XrtA/PEP-CTERM system histidine kinase PrsK n=1 Tax=unclassified Iodidimonas TaxID=2626145 RepID=UPI002482A906|nr:MULTISPECIES: XrtA/PEP-CTERM system histidine kinase PrsK [unclassified Iodidimonas]
MIHFWTFALTAVGFIALALLLLRRGWRQRQSRLFAMAAFIHGLWAASQIYGTFPFSTHLAWLLYTAHFLGWALFLVSLLPQSSEQSSGQSLGGLQRIVGLLAPILILSKIISLLGFGIAPALLGQIIYILDLSSMILGLAALVGVFQATNDYERWHLKFICIPLGVAFAYDLVVHAQIFAMGDMNTAYHNIRGLLNLAIVPFLFISAARYKFWRDPFFVSRQAVLYSLTLIGVGFYLLLVAAAALILPELSEDAALPLQIGLFFFALMMLLFFLSSGSARARIKLFVARHFYSRKYDYAHEWRRLMGTLATDGRNNSSLEYRIIKACAEILESPGGALWVLEQDRPRLQATWNFRPAAHSPHPVSIDLFQDDQGALHCLYDQRLAQSPFHEDRAAWIVIPLPHLQNLNGFLILTYPRVANKIDVEDEDLLLLVAQQCASFLAESKAAAILEENRQFARFNRQYAFVAHDLKNIISQLSLMLKNFDKHSANPEFQRDMHETIQHSVERMQKLITRLTQVEAGKGSAEEPEEIAVYPILQHELAKRAENGGGKALLKADIAAHNLMLHVPKERFCATIGHLLSNAFEAGDVKDEVEVSLDLIGDKIIIDITDHGAGMSPEFIRDTLFVPFRSTKRSGFGVGAFQCREFAREQGGDLDVISSPGSGTTMRLSFPALL